MSNISSIKFLSPKMDTASAFISIRVRQDNLMYLFYNEDMAISVDSYEPEVILAALSCNFDKTVYKQEEILSLQPGRDIPRKLVYSLTTHRHFDHAGGNAKLSKLSPETVIIQKDVNVSIPDKNIPWKITLLFTPCHTACSISYFIQKDARSWLLTGDLLFKLGCGKFFEGSGSDFVTSIEKIDKECQNDTILLYGHDYFENNLMFAKSVMPKGYYITKEFQEIAKACFLTWEQEKLYNPFLYFYFVDRRVDSSAFIESLRKKKDKFC